MSQKPGRNDPCTCGSGKKYKNCCLGKHPSAGASLASKRKFTAKVISAGGMKKETTDSDDLFTKNMAADYGALMERSFGEASRDTDEAPPIPSDPSVYLPSEEK